MCVQWAAAICNGKWDLGQLINLTVSKPSKVKETLCLLNCLPMVALDCSCPVKHAYLQESHIIMPWDAGSADKTTKHA